MRSYEKTVLVLYSAPCRNRLRSLGSPRILCSTSANSAVLPSSASSPLKLCVMTLLTQGMANATHGVPHPIASVSTSPNASGSMNRSPRYPVRTEGKARIAADPGALVMLQRRQGRNRDQVAVGKRMGKPPPFFGIAGDDAAPMVREHGNLVPGAGQVAHIGEITMRKQ